MIQATNFKRTSHKPSRLASGKPSLSKSRYRKGINSPTQKSLDLFEAAMFNANSPSPRTVSPYISYPFEDFENDASRLPLMDYRQSIILNIVRSGKVYLSTPAVDPRKVHFASELEHVHFLTYPSSTSKQQRWYQRKDYQSFKEDVRATIIALHRARGLLHQLDIKEFTVSGLEKSLTLQQVMARKRNGSIHVQAVLWQQMQCNDPMRIRQISELFTKSSMQRARFRGLLDSDLLGTFDKTDRELGIDFFEERQEPEYF